MEFKNFTELIRDKIAEQVGNGYQVHLNNVRKNNGIELIALTVLQEKNNVSPAIYLKEYYENYISGKETLDSIVNQIIDVYNENKIDPNINLGCILNYEDAKPRIIYKLINTEKNKELLKDVPHIDFFDLSIVFQCIVLQEEFEISTFLIHDDHRKVWNVSVEDLYRVAMENTPKLLRCEIKSMAETFCDIVQSEYSDITDEELGKIMRQFAGSIPMFVMSNQCRVEGASCMLYRNILACFAQSISNSFYIIPSSIHELLLIPAQQCIEDESIKSMIREINDTQVSNEEILSYSLYFYDKEEGEIVKK